MAEEQVAEVTNEAPVEKQEAKPVLDSNRPLSQQVNKILEAMPKEEEDVKSDEEVKEQAPEEVKEEVASEEEPVEQAVEEEASDEDDYAAPEAVELPSWQQYIFDNLPSIKVNGHTKTGQDKTFEVKRAEDLPDSFEFRSKKDELEFVQALAAQESNARQLLADYQQKEQQNQMAEYQRQEALDISSDIERLQKDGVLDKFKYKEDDPRFNDDPAVKVSNDIYEIYKKTNERYIKEGRTFRISFLDAADKYFYQQARNAKVEKPAVKNEVKKEREEVAKAVSAQQGAAPDQVRKVMPRGSSMQDIYRLYKQGRI
jgi:hypothetical protein